MRFSLFTVDILILSSPFLNRMLFYWFLMINNECLTISEWLIRNTGRTCFKHRTALSKGFSRAALLSIEQEFQSFLLTLVSDQDFNIPCCFLVSEPYQYVGLVSFLVHLIQTRVVCVKRTSIEKICLQKWPVHEVMRNFLDWQLTWEGTTHCGWSPPPVLWVYGLRRYTKGR